MARRALVADGVLQGWTLDLATARQLGLPSTGNAGRGTSAPPSPSAGNLALTQGHGDAATELLAEMGTGLLVTSLIGASINPTTGDYSRGASGFWVENGEIVRPVNECTIAGNLRAMLRTIRPANDARPHLGRVVPSLLVEGLVIAGALTSRCSRRRRGRPARSRSRRVGRPGRGAREAGRPRAGQRGRPRGRPPAARPAAGGAARTTAGSRRRARTGRSGSRRRRVFIVDPIDGTRAFLAGERGLGACRSRSSRPAGSVAGVVHLPALGAHLRRGARAAARG